MERYDLSKTVSRPSVASVDGDFPDMLNYNPYFQPLYEYVQPSFSAPWGFEMPHPTLGLPCPPEYSRPSGAHSYPFVVSAHVGREYRPGRQISLDADLPVAGTSQAGPLIPVLEEITIPYEKPPLASCDFQVGLTSLTLGDVLKTGKKLSRKIGDDSQQAFPSRQCATKLAFWFVFDLGSSFGSRRKQVTVATTRGGKIEQPSKARLAYLVAREMQKYLEECMLKNTPFPYTLDSIVLQRVDLVSKGTLRPRLYKKSY